MHLELISEEEVRTVLMPHHQRLAGLARRAWGLWAHSETGAGRLLPEPLSRARAAYVSNGFHNLAKAEFSEMPDVHVVDECQRVLLVFADRFVLRFKLLTRDFQTVNYPTEASNDMDDQKQIGIPGIEQLPRVVFGYLVGGIPDQMTDLRIQFSIGKRLLWGYDLEDKGQQLMLPIQPPPQTLPERFRMKGEQKQRKDKGAAQT